MGRTIVTPKKQAIPPGFLQELNCDLMEDLWYALAAAKHPEALEEEHSHLSLEELFGGCLADVTWADFWHAFPYELREQGDCLDEIDALGLLLSTQISRSRFERHFEQLATSSSSSNSSNSSGSGTSQQTTALPARVTGSINRSSSSSSSRALTRAFGAAPAPRPLGDLFSGTMAALAAMQDAEAAAAAAAAGSRRRDGQFPLQYPLDQIMQYPPEQSWMHTVVAAAGAGAGQPRQQPVRRLSRRSLAVPPPSGQQQQLLQGRQQHVAYVSPAAPGRTTATTRTPGRTAGLYAAALGPGRTGQQQQQQRPPQQQQQHPVPGTEQYTGLFDLLQQQLGAAPPSPPYVAPQSPTYLPPGSPGYQPASPLRQEPPSPTYSPGSPTHRGQESPTYQPYSPYDFRGAESPVYQPAFPESQPAAPQFSPTSPVWQGPSSPGYAPASPVYPPWQALRDIQFEPFREGRSGDEGAAAAAQGPSEAAAVPLHPSMLQDPPAADEPHSSSRVRSLVSTVQAAMAGQATAAAAAAEAGSAAAAAAAGWSMPPPRTNTTTVHTAGRVSAAAAAAAVPFRASESAAALGAGAFLPNSRLRAWRGMLDAGAVVPGMGPMPGPPLFRAPPAAAAPAAAAAAAAGSPAGQDVSDAVAAAAAARLPAGLQPEGFARAMLSLARSYAPSPGTLAAAEAAIPAAAAAATAAAGAGNAGMSLRQPAAAPPAAAAAPPAGSAASAGGGQRLTGNRRTWQEACDPEGFEQRQQQQQQQARAATGDQAGPATGAGSTAAGAVADAAAGAGAGTSAGQVGVDGSSRSSSDGAAGGSSSSGSRQRVNYSKVWRAVHEWLTGEDEDLLELVSQVVPYSLAGRSLKAQEDTLQQLRALASSRAVPQKVVTAVADRLYQPCPSGEAHLVRLTASSGFSKRAAAAAAVLDCCERHGMLPFYIPLAGLCTADAVEAAVMQGLFGGQRQAQPVVQQQQQQQQESAGVAADAAAAGASAAGEAAAAAAAAAQAALAALGRLPGDLTLADMGAMVALLDSNEAAFLAGSAPPPPAAAGTPPGQLRGLDLGNLGFLASLGGAAATAGSLGFPLGPLGGAAAAAGGGPRSISGPPGSRGGGEDGDQLAAHLTLLGRCHSRQPMLLWLDEVDAAMTPEDGRPLREVLMQLLYRLPQAVVVMTSSSGLEAWRDAAVLRQVGEPLVQELTDGKLVLVEHRLPKSHLHPRCYDYIL